MTGGHYTDAGGYIRDLTRDDHQRRAEMEAAVEDGLASGRSSRTIEEILAEEKSRLIHDGK